MRRGRAQEHDVAAAVRPRATDVVQQRVSSVLGQRQADLAPTFGADPQGAVRPADLAEPQFEHVAGTQPETCQQKQDGSVADAMRLAGVAGSDHPLDVGGGQVARQDGQPPLRDGWHGMHQLRTACARGSQKAKVAAQGGCHGFGVSRQRVPDLVQDGLSDRCGRVARRIGSERGRQARNHVAMLADGAFGNPTMLAQPLLELRHTGVHGRRLWQRHPLDEPALRQEPDEAPGSTDILRRNAVAAPDTRAVAMVGGKACAGGGIDIADGDARALELNQQVAGRIAVAAHRAVLHGPGMLTQLPQPRLWFRRCGQRSGDLGPACG